MSLHAHLSPEARERYRIQRRLSTAASLATAFLSVLLVGLILAYLILELPPRTIETTIIVPGAKPLEDPPRPKELTTFRKPSPAPGGSRTRVLVATNRTDLAIPQPDLLPTESLPFGDGDGLGIGIGDADEFNPGGYGRIPGPLKKRCSESDRLQRLRETGGAEEIEPAVVKALQWLESQQSADGSWGAEHKVGITGLALLAYLGHCETPASEKFGESCMDGIVFLLDVAARNNGKLATNFQDRHWPYEHALATYALAEAYSFGPAFNYEIPGHRSAVRDAGQWIIDNQHESGGWDYAYEESSARGGDLSVTGWHLQALKACEATGIEFRNMTATVRRALDYVEARQASHGGFGYTGTSPAGGSNVYSLTGVGALSFQIWGKASHPAARKGVRYIQKNAPFDYRGTQSDLYAHYYYSQALLQHGGQAWDDYNVQFTSQLLAAQQADGSFAQPGNGQPVAAVAALFAQNTPEGILYRHCLCTLMLEVYYRYLPGTAQ